MISLFAISTQRGLVHDRAVVQLLVRVLGGEDRDGGLVDRRAAHAGVEVAGGERRGGHAADAARGDSGVCRNLRAARWFSGTRPRAKLSAPPATCVWTSTPPGKTIMPVASIVRPPSTVGDDPAVVDADVLDDAVDRRWPGRRLSRR